MSQSLESLKARVLGEYVAHPHPDDPQKTIWLHKSVTLDMWLDGLFLVAMVEQMTAEARHATNCRCVIPDGVPMAFEGDLPAYIDANPSVLTIH